jgi:hypothetical protein
MLKQVQHDRRNDMSYKLNNSIVSPQEAEALKAMIFKRAQERAQSLAEETQKTYTDNFQVEVMNLARESFVANKNPFSQNVKTEAQPASPEVKKEQLVAEIGYAKRHISEIKNQIYYRNKDINDNIANKEVESAMDDARVSNSRKNSFTGALEFLNSQASISLMNRRKSGFEAIA